MPRDGERRSQKWRRVRSERLPLRPEGQTLTALRARGWLPRLRDRFARVLVPYFC
jgi:hypothetical protein